MDNPEKDLAEQVLAASGLSPSRLGLRFDRVVLRVLGDLRTFAETSLPDGSAAIVAISAPIRLPAKTAQALREMIAAGDREGVAFGNQVSVRRVARVSPNRPRLVGFVHNPGADTGQLRDLAQAWLRA